MSKRFARGDRVAHATIDSPDGGAKAGVVEEYVGDGEAGVVIIRNPDGTAEGFDRREVVALRGAGPLAAGPVLLAPRHFLAMLRRPAGLLSFAFALVVASALNVLSARHGWDPGIIIAVGVGVTAMTVWIALAIQRSRAERAATAKP